MIKAAWKKTNVVIRKRIKTKYEKDENNSALITYLYIAMTST